MDKRRQSRVASKLEGEICGNLGTSRVQPGKMQDDLIHDTPKGEQDRRKTGQRFCISAAARFHWLGSDGVRRESTGTTRDISSNGIFIQADSFPLPGDAVEVVVSLPPLRRGGSGAQLHGKGVAIRLDGEERSSEAFAAEVVFRVAKRRLPPSPG